MNQSSFPQLTAPRKQGLYDPRFEHDACGTGFVVNIKGIVSHDIIGQGLTILDNLAHRGATGSETDTGDGAGILIQVPHKFFQRESAKLGFSLPGERYFGVGMLYLPQDEKLRHQFEGIIEMISEEEGQHVLGWRTVPTDDSTLGPTAKAAQPVIRQFFVERNKTIKDRLSFERKLYV
ncbi:MAG: glutamate synthase subunit alpha, partial [Chloroflexi bacterium HGW-Chloroflexi-7]